MAFDNYLYITLQETEVIIRFPDNVLDCGGYNIELKQNSVKKRVNCAQKLNSNLSFNVRMA